MKTSEMTLERKVGQMIVGGFYGTEFNEMLREAIGKYHMGNIILFSRNYESPEALYNLIKELQRYAIEKNGAPLFIAIDQEGGTVTRLTHGVTFFPGNMAIASAGDESGAYTAGLYMGEELRALGINMNLAPILDLCNNYQNPIIGSRAYGEDPKAAGSMGSAFIRGLQKAGIIAVAKHFPGQGNTTVDTHLDICALVSSAEEIRQTEMLPFREAMAGGLSGMMSAHVLYPAFDGKLPATLSRKILKTLLRDELGYTGLIITDCLEMKAIDDYFGTVNGAALSAGAGADLLLISHTFEKQIEAIEKIVKGVNSGDIEQSRINEAAIRIERFKKSLDISGFLNSTYHDVLKIIENEEHRRFSEVISRKSITMIRDGGLFPIKPGEDAIFISSNADSLIGVDEIIDERYINSLLKLNYPHMTIEDIHVNPVDDEIDYLVEKVRNRSKVVICTYNANLNPNQVKLVEKIYKANQNLGVIAMRNPHDISYFKNVPNYVLAYEYTPLSIKSVVSFIKGEIGAEGKCPVNLGI